MKFKLNLLKKVFIVVVMFMTFSVVNSQELNKEGEEIIDELFLYDDLSLDDFLDSLFNYQFLMASINYDDDVYFSGRDIGIDQYSLTPSIYYINSNGLLFGFSSTMYSEFDPKWDTSTLMAGYFNYFGKNNNYRYKFSYSRYFFSDNTESTFNNNLAASLIVRTNDKKLGAEIEFSYLFGDENYFNTTFEVFGKLNLATFKNFNKLTFEPSFTTFIGQESIELSRVTSMLQGTPQIQYYEDKVFDMINAQLRLPINLSLGDFDVELGYNINFPFELENETNLETTSYFNASIMYMIDLK